MRTNLIQNYLSSPKYSGSSAKEKPEFSIERELNNKTFIKPLDSRGHLIQNEIVDIPATAVKGITYDIKSVKHGLSGNANDHELGKVNDVAMKLGGLAIASYLFTRKQTPLTKVMEFVGLGSFFASMAIWPKLAIHLPAKIIHGVNVGQEYEDSFGRKKPFYQDPQFLPWSLYSDKKIEKIGDRLKVPKDMQNRREYTQEKMKKIALQSNTLWMLTAGFATPTMSGLICNQLEGPVGRYLNKVKNKKADRMLEDFAKTVKSHKNNEMIHNLEKVIELNKNAPITDAVYADIAKVLTKGFDLVTASGIETDLKNILMPNKYTIDKITVIDIAKNMQTALKKENVSENVIEALVPSEGAITKSLKNKNFMSASLQPKELRKIIGAVIEPLRENIKNYNILNAENKVSEDYIINKIINNDFEKTPIGKALNKSKVARFDATSQAVLKNFANILTDFKVKMGVLDEYALIKVGAAPETVIANFWNDVSNSMIKILKISNKEITRSRYDKELMSELMRGKLEKIASNTKDYNRALKMLTNKIATLDKYIKEDDLTDDWLSASKRAAFSKNDASALPNYDKRVNEVFKEAYTKLEAINMKNSAKFIYGDANNEGGTLRHLQKKMVSDRILGVKSSFMRLISTLDFYRRIATLENIPALHDKMALAVKEEIVELSKQMIIKGHSADFATKFYFIRNPHANTTDLSQIEVSNGKVINKHLNKFAANVPQNGVDIPHDLSFFREVMKLLFENKMHSDTEAILKNHLKMSQEFSTYRGLVMEKVGDYFYFAKPRHFASQVRNEGYKVPSDLSFLLTGSAPEEMLSKVGRQRYNTNKWLKMFGGLGLGLLAVTVWAQSHFGKLDTAKKVQKDTRKTQKVQKSPKNVQKGTKKVQKGN